MRYLELWKVKVLRFALLFLYVSLNMQSYKHELFPPRFYAYNSLNHQEMAL